MKYKINLKFKLLIPLIALLAIVSCDRDQVDEPQPYTNSLVSYKQMDNPYALSVMEMAYGNLATNGGELEDYAFEPTHYYVKFMPADEDELAVLKLDSNLIFELGALKLHQPVVS